MGLFRTKKQDKIKRQKEIEKVSSTSIKIKVYSSMGGNIRVKKNEYTATEKRDEFKELVSINDDYNHKEDVEFSEDSIYTEMKVLLNLQNSEPKKQKEILKKKIRSQERLIFYLNKIPELNAIYNYQDENGKLRDLRVLENNLKLDKGGSFFYIENGVRTYEFDSVDGFLIPRWHGVDTYSSFPDHTRLKKIKIQEDVIFQKEILGMKLNNKLINYATIFFAVNLIFMFIVGLGGVTLYQKYSNAPFVQAEQQCVDTAVKLNQQYGELIKDAIIIKQEQLKEKPVETVDEKESFIKDLTPK